MKNLETAYISIKLLKYLGSNDTLQLIQHVMELYFMCMYVRDLFRFKQKYFYLL